MQTIAFWMVAMAFLWCAIDLAHGTSLTTSCMKFEEDYNFKEEKYVGTWYEVRRLYDPAEEQQEDCVVMNYELGEKGCFDIQQSYQYGDEREPTYRTGWAEPKVFQNARVPKFLERFNTSNPGDPDISIDIVATDYTSYAIIYSCTSVNTTHFIEAAWVLSRQPALAKNVVELVNVFLENQFQGDHHKWRATKQTPDFCKPSLVEHVTESAANSQNRVSFAGLALAVLLAKVF